MILSHPPNIKHLIPSGYVKIAIENGPVEIVDLPIKHGDFPQVCKRLPEGKWSQFFTINRFESFSTPRDNVHKQVSQPRDLDVEQLHIRNGWKWDHIPPRLPSGKLA